MSEAGGPYIAALDVGTTTVRCHVFDSQARTVSSASKTVSSHPHPRLPLLSKRSSSGHASLPPAGLRGDRPGQALAGRPARSAPGAVQLSHDPVLCTSARLKAECCRCPGGPRRVSGNVDAAQHLGDVGRERGDVPQLRHVEGYEGGRADRRVQPVGSDEGCSGCRCETRNLGVGVCCSCSDWVRTVCIC